MKISTGQGFPDSFVWNAALDLMKNENVHAITGPQRSTEAKFVAKLGEKAHVPILSFSATSPFLSPNHNPFFIQTP